MVVFLKKYVCPNCGLVGRKETRGQRENRHRIRRECRNCSAKVYSSDAVLKSIMQIYVAENGR